MVVKSNRSNKCLKIKIKSFLLIHKILGALHEELHGLLHPVRDGHQGGAQDEHPQRPRGLTEAGSEDSEGAKVSNEGDQQSKQSNEHTKLHPGVGGDLLSEAEANFHCVFEADISLYPLGQSCRVNIINFRTILALGMFSDLPWL